MTMGPKYVFGSGRQRLAKRMKMGRQWPIVVFRWACHFRVKCNLIVKIFDRLPISQIAVLASTLTRRILKTPTRLFQCCGEIDMVDFSDPYYGSVDWTVVVALLLFIVSGTALLYRALAPIFLPKVNNKRKRAKLFKKDSPDNLGGFELLQSHFELSSAQIQALDSQGTDDANICDLFVNRRLGLSEVASLANTTEGTVIRTLLKREIVRDRRGSAGQPPDGIERRRAAASKVIGFSLVPSPRT
jgi:hypothetical protein